MTTSFDADVTEAPAPAAAPAPRKNRRALYLGVGVIAACIGIGGAAAYGSAHPVEIPGTAVVAAGAEYTPAAAELDMAHAAVQDATSCTRAGVDLYIEGGMLAPGLKAMTESCTDQIEEIGPFIDAGEFTLPELNALYTWTEAGSSVGDFMISFSNDYIVEGRMVAMEGAYADFIAAGTV